MKRFSLRRVRTLFGDDLFFGFLAGPQRGKLFPGMFGGRKSPTFRDGIRSAKRLLGAILQVLAITAQETAEPLAHVLNTVGRLYPAMVPILVPLPQETDHFPPNLKRTNLPSGLEWVGQQIVGPMGYPEFRNDIQQKEAEIPASLQP
jgi:hypothetical protein